MVPELQNPIHFFYIERHSYQQPTDVLFCDTICVKKNLHRNSSNISDLYSSIYEAMVCLKMLC